MSRTTTPHAPSSTALAHHRVRVRRRALRLVGAAALCLAHASAADQILTVYDASLTTYLPAGSTPVQGVRPLVLQRGVGIDGSTRAGSVFDWIVGGNRFGGVLPDARVGEVRLATGTLARTEIDLRLPALVPWGVGRSYNQAQLDSGSSHQNSNGPQGTNWFQLSQPELVLFEHTSDDDKDVLYLVYGADRFLEFRRTGDPAETFRGVNGAHGVVEREPGSPDVWVWYDERGWRTYFFGGNTASARADWQIWKIVDPAGNAAFAGDASSASSAVSGGYNADSTLAVAFDSSGRRFTYGYNAIDSVSRLTEVTVETDDTDDWGDGNTDVTEVARVTYAYYQTGDTTHGPAGSLKLATVRRALSGSGADLGSGVYEERHQLYRYYTQSWDDSDGRRGGPGMLKMIVDAEGCRNYDWGEDGAETPPDLDQGFLSASDSSLKPYASAYFEHASGSDWRVASAFFSGECGCGGAANGTHTFAYALNGSHPATSAYDTAWHARTVVGQPDGVYRTAYFDEVAQPLSSVVTDGNPAVSYTDSWATAVVRDASGCVTEVRTPANEDTNTPYAHATGAITASSGAGLITVYERIGSGDTRGLLQAVKHKIGTGGTEQYDSYQTYSTRDLEVASGVHVTRALVTARRAYHTEGASASASANYDETTMGYAFHGSTSTAVTYLAVKSVTTTLPAVSAGQNGSGTGTASTIYLRPDGSLAFAAHADGTFDYTRHERGLTTARVRDVTLNGSFPAGDDPNTDFGITENADGLHVASSMTYDAVGRAETSTSPDGRVSRRYSTRLADGRLVSIGFPREASGTRYGPASYTVSNLAGHAVFQGTIAIGPSGLNDALSAYIDEAEDDPVAALQLGALARMATSVYDKSGAQLERTRAYHAIPGSGVGTSGTNYDETRYTYDAMGRTIRTLSPTGTITRTTYDDLGRVATRSVGTNDNGLPGGSASGPSTMVTTESVQYDGGSDGKNSLVTARTLYVQGSTTDQRVTQFLHDPRGRTIVTLSPEAPHTLVKLDNLGRTLAVGLYTSTSGLDADDDPTSLATNRAALARTYFDALGRVYKSTRHKINPSSGADEASLESLTWYDAMGRVAKQDGAQLTKSTYDRLGRVKHAYVLIKDDDTTYAHALDVSGDTIASVSQPMYQSKDSDNLLAQVTIERHADTSGGAASNPADTNADTDNLKITAADVTGRVRIVAMWYDELDRVTDVVDYGTNAIVGDGSSTAGTWNRSGLAVPTSGVNNPRTTTSYNDDGTVFEVTDPAGIVTRTEYDALGRQTRVVRNYVDGTAGPGDEDQVVLYEYANGLLATMTADLATDQVTRYIYGTTIGTPSASTVATGHLLRAVVYPDSTNTGTTAAAIDGDASDVVSYAYNAQGEMVYEKDQAGTERHHVYDTAGRRAHDRVTALGSGIDSAVLRISTAHDGLGRVSTVTQHTSATVGSGSIVDQVRYTYDGWGNVTKFEADHDSAVTGSGNYYYAVDHTFATATGGRNTLRRVTSTIPGTTGSKATLTFGYGAANGTNDVLSRVEKVDLTIGLLSTVTVAEYKYMGLASVIESYLGQPDIFRRHAHASTVGVYPDLDRFGRVTSDRWTKDLSTDVDFFSVAVTYDAAGNITRTQDAIHVNSSTGVLDVAYTLDGLHRVTGARRGHWNGSAIASTQADEAWTLDPLGNWDLYRLDLNGDLNYSDAGELDDARTHSLANEIVTRDTDSDSSTDYTLSHDAAGNLVDDQQHHTFTYDAWGRLRTVSNQSSGLVAEYRYNGLGFRIAAHTDVTDDGTTGDPDGSVDGYDPWYHLVHNERWQHVATFRGTDASPKERFVWHSAGLDGDAGSSYIDALMLRDRDASTAWHSASDGTLEERVYTVHNWRSDAVARVSAAGKMLEWVTYTPYGLPRAMPAGDTNSDGDWDAADAIAVTGGYDVRKDADLDGTVDSNDVAHANSIAGGYQTLGFAVLSSAAIGATRGYAGYQALPELARTMWHVRHRVLDSELGRWTRRDPLGYVDGMGLYEYVGGMAVRERDPAGLWRYCTTAQCNGAWPGQSPLSAHARCVCHCCVDLGGCFKSTWYGSDCEFSWADFYKGPAYILCITACLSHIVIPGI